MFFSLKNLYPKNALIEGISFKIKKENIKLKIILYELIGAKIDNSPRFSALIWKIFPIAPINPEKSANLKTSKFEKSKNLAPKRQNKVKIK